MEVTAVVTPFVPVATTSTSFSACIDVVSPSRAAHRSELPFEFAAAVAAVAVVDPTVDPDDVESLPHAANPTVKNDNPITAPTIRPRGQPRDLEVFTVASVI